MLQMMPGYDSTDSMYSVTDDRSKQELKDFTQLRVWFKVTREHHARNIFRKAMCNVDMFWDASVCVMKPCNLPSASAVLLDTCVSQDVPSSEIPLSVHNAMCS